MCRSGETEKVLPEKNDGNEEPKRDNSETLSRKLRLVSEGFIQSECLPE